VVVTKDPVTPAEGSVLEGSPVVVDVGLMGSIDAGGVFVGTDVESIGLIAAPTPLRAKRPGMKSTLGRNCRRARIG
jgi:hypothetical protein